MSRKDRSSSSFNKQRRKFLRFLGLGGAVVIGNSAAAQIRVNKADDKLNQLSVTTSNNYIFVRLLRPEDLLSLELRYYNFELVSQTLKKKANPAYLVVIFQPQSISEQAWNETGTGMETPTVPGRIMIGGDSRLVFQIPASITSIPLNLNDLLAWEKYDLVVNARAKHVTGKLVIHANNSRINNIKSRMNSFETMNNLPNARGLSKDERRTINSLIIPETYSNDRREMITNLATNIIALTNEVVGPVSEMETSLEVPMRLYLSPTKHAGWKHLKKITADKGIIKETNRMFELWHTRMGTKTAKGIDESPLTNEQRILRALWADDADKDYTATVVPQILPNDPILLLTSMNNKDRHRIVHESSNFQIKNFVPPPIKAHKLFLTTLGAWLDSEFVVERKKLETAAVINGTPGKDSSALNLLKWRHIETLGREHYVEIVEAGNIMPFGHEAVLIKITERKPHIPTGTAANFQRTIVVITEPVKEYNYRDGSGEFLTFSFSSVEMITTVSPLLDKDDDKKKLVDTPAMVVTDQFIIRSSLKDVLFKVKAEDLDGNHVNFSLPLAFISTNVLGSASNRTALVKAYNDGIRIKNWTDFNGQRFTLAPPAVNGADTAYVAQKVTFQARTYSNADEPQGFLPMIGEANIVEPSYQRLTGVANTVGVSLVDDKNDGHVFAKFSFATPVNFGGQTDKTGGLAAPNFNLSGLSKAAGAFGGDITKFMKAEASADDFFNVSSLPDPSLFGVFKLSDILDFVKDDKSSYDLSKPLLDRVPKIPNLVTQETETEFITSYVIKPKLKYPNLGDFVGIIEKPGAEFAITTQVKAKKKSPTSPEFSTEAWIRKFGIGIVKVDTEWLISLAFEEIKFVVDAGKKADVSVKMGSPCIVFGGPLSFINEINRLIPTEGFSDPPYLDVSLTGIKCGYTLALPDLQLGAFTLSHISLGAEVNLPFTGGPLTFSFRFCERQQPFTLTVSCLGGGGFFGLELDLNGIRQIEASLEFGAAVSINLGVASGSVSVMAGIYFKMTMTSGHNSTELTGYVRINGSVSVLGLITASLELYLGLTWLISEGKAYGEASLKISIEILFFSTSVTVHTTKTFAGNGSDPNFQMALTERDWQDYCAAFAA